MGKQETVRMERFVLAMFESGRMIMGNMPSSSSDGDKWEPDEFTIYEPADIVIQSKPVNPSDPNSSIAIGFRTGHSVHPILYMNTDGTQTDRPKVDASNAINILYVEKMPPDVAKQITQRYNDVWGEPVSVNAPSKIVVPTKKIVGLDGKSM